MVGRHGESLCPGCPKSPGSVIGTLGSIKQYGGHYSTVWIVLEKNNSTFVCLLASVGR